MRCHHISKQKRKLTNWSAYDADLRQSGSVTIWFNRRGDRGLATGAAINPWQKPVIFAVGDLEARVSHVLLRTPDFVDSWILDRALNPAIRKFDYEGATMIDLSRLVTLRREAARRFAPVYAR